MSTNVSRRTPCGVAPHASIWNGSMSRKAHLVGSWPGRSPSHAMDVALSRLAPHLCRMSDGETGHRSLWITPSIEAMRANPDLELIRDGDNQSYETTLQFKVRDGVAMDPNNITLNYQRSFQESFPQFKVLRERYARPDLRFQVGMPSPFDLTLVPFGPAGLEDPQIEAAFVAATVDQICKIDQEAGDQVVFQLEMVSPLVFLAQAPDEQQPQVAAMLAAKVLQVIEQAPEGARFGFHLCLGDFKHKAFGNMRDVRPLVLLANTIAEAWPLGRILEYIHAPFAAAAEPPIAEGSFYEPLQELRLPDSTRFVAGFIHESVDLDGHRALLARIERLAGRQVDVAAACGLARRPSDEQAWDAMDKAVALIKQSAGQAEAVAQRL